MKKYLRILLVLGFLFGFNGLVNAESVSSANCSANTSPYLKIISPNGGEVYKPGQLIDLKWTDCNIADSEKINVSLFYSDSSGNHGGKSIIYRLQNDGIEKISLPSQKEMGTSRFVYGLHYKIGISREVATASESQYRDYSDNLFTITDNPSSVLSLSKNVEENVALDISDKIKIIPRIMYWQGKVNQHIDTENGEWSTDPDGVSGAEIDKLTYCKKWYPNTISVKDYQIETTGTWQDRGNVNYYKWPRMSTLCIQSNNLNILEYKRPLSNNVKTGKVFIYKIKGSDRVQFSGKADIGDIIDELDSSDATLFSYFKYGINKNNLKNETKPNRMKSVGLENNTYTLFTENISLGSFRKNTKYYFQACVGQKSSDSDSVKAVSCGNVDNFNTNDQVIVWSDQEEDDDIVAQKPQVVNKIPINNLNREQVRIIQQKLIDNGLLKIKQPTAYFGTLSKNALSTFQRMNNLQVDTNNIDDNLIQVLSKTTTDELAGL